MPSSSQTKKQRPDPQIWDLEWKTTQDFGVWLFAFHKSTSKYGGSALHRLPEKSDADK